jgi:uncharacterized protein (DUF302 family)
MRYVILAFILLCSIVSGPAIAADGLITLKSNYSVEKTADRLESLLNEKGMTLFKRVDHTEGAKGVGLDLRPTELIIFGNPKVGTPLMQCQQTAAIDLPQKALIWEDEAGEVWLAYNDPEYMAERHGLEGCDKAIKKVKGALKKFAEGAVD